MEAERGRVLAAVDDVIAALERPLSAADRAENWSEDDRHNYRNHFIGLRSDIERGAYAGRRPKDHRQLMRWLNYDGIGLGPLAVQIGELQQLLRDTFADENERRRRLE